MGRVRVTVEQPLPDVRSIARRYVWCANALAAIVGLVVLGVVAGVVLPIDHRLADVVGTPGEVLVLLGVTVATGLLAVALLRHPSRGEAREHGRSATGFEEVSRVRQRLREGVALTAAEQEIADDLAVLCARSIAERRWLLLLPIAGAAGLLLLLLHPPSHGSPSPLMLAELVVGYGSAAVADWRRTDAVLDELGR